MSEEDRLLAEVLRPLMEEVARRQADHELNSAWARFKKVTGRLFEYEIARIEQLIEQPDRYSVKEWEKVRTGFEWTARKFTNLVERMEEARPLTKIDDTHEVEVEGNAEDVVAEKSSNKAGRRKLTESQVSQIKTLVNAGELSLEEIAKQFGVSPAEISGIKNERYWPLVEPRINGRLDRYEAKGGVNVGEADERSGTAVINKDAAETPLSPPERSRVTPADGGNRGRAAPSKIVRRF